MSDLKTQRQIGRTASMAAHNRILRTPKYIALLDAAIDSCLLHDVRRVAGAR